MALAGLVSVIQALTGLTAASDGATSVPLRVIAPWSIEVGSCAIPADTGERTIAAPVRIDVAPPEIIAVTDEEHPRLAPFNPKAGGWMKGNRLAALITQECTATGLLSPGSLRVKPEPGDAAPFMLGQDYDLEPFWATVGRLEDGAIKESQPVFLDYKYRPCRLDSIVLTAEGRMQLLPGEPGIGVVLPPDLPPEAMLLANIWVPGDAVALTQENLYPIDFRLAAEKPEPQAERLLPKTLAKLRAGEPVTIVAWGDSVTNGGGVNQDYELWYQNQFLKRLRERFPQTDITLHTAAWGGRGTRDYLEAPAGGEKDFVRDVLERKPDLITIEFVNDAYLDEEGVCAHYKPFLDRMRAIGAEVVLITPHLVRPDWMKVDSMKFDADPRPYVAGLHRIAAGEHVAVADASKEWCRLWRRGIPYITLEANSINHPDERGHAIFADALMALFPEE